MFNSNQVTMNIDGTEYTLSLNRKGIEAIEKYTKLSSKREEIEKTTFLPEYVDEIGLNDDPFAGIAEEEATQKLDEMLEMMKRVLWICLWENHKLNIEQVRELLVKIVEDDEKFAEMNEKVQKLIEGVNKQPNGGLKNLKALKAQK
jgi:hypothetical protein